MRWVRTALQAARTRSGLVLDRTVVVAVTIVRMVQMIADAVVDVVAVHDGSVTAARTVCVTGLVGVVRAARVRHTARWVHHRDRNA